MSLDRRAGKRFKGWNDNTDQRGAITEILKALERLSAIQLTSAMMEPSGVKR
jgi:hypothetical protein